MVRWVRIMLGGHSSRRIRMNRRRCLSSTASSRLPESETCAMPPCRLRPLCLVRLPWPLWSGVKHAPPLLDSLIVPLIVFSSCPRPYYQSASSSDCTACWGGILGGAASNRISKASRSADWLLGGARLSRLAPLMSLTNLFFDIPTSLRPSGLPRSLTPRATPRAKVLEIH